MSSDLELRIAGLEAMLCDAQRENEELRAKLLKWEEFYRAVLVPKTTFLPPLLADPHAT
jgi:hypothetical protein